MTSSPERRAVTSFSAAATTTSSPEAPATTPCTAAPATTFSTAGRVDRLHGGAGDDQLLPGQSEADRLSGGLGFDTVSYAAFTVGVTVNLADGTTGGGAAGQTFKSIEALVGSGLVDNLTPADGGTAFGGAATMSSLPRAARCSAAMRASIRSTETPPTPSRTSSGSSSTKGLTRLTPSIPPATSCR